MSAPFTAPSKLRSPGRRATSGPFITVAVSVGITVTVRAVTPAGSWLGSTTTVCDGVAS